MPTDQIINDVLPWTQVVASNGQTVFDTNWTCAYEADIVVYKRGENDEPDENTQKLLSNAYNVSFVGTNQVVRITLLSGAVLGDIVTITRQTAVDRLNLYTNTNFVPSMLNQDTALLTLVDQERQMLDQFAVKYHISGLNPNFSSIENPPVVPLGPNQIWAMNPDGTAFIAYDVPEGGGVATDKAKFLLQQPHIGLPNAQAMSEQPTGFVVSNGGSGVQVTRIIKNVANQTIVLNSSGLADDPSIGIADNPIIPGKAGMGVPAGTTAERVTPTGTNISLRFNTDLGQLEAYIGGNWVLVPSSAAGLFLPLSGGTMAGNIDMNGNLITNLDTPVAAGDAVNKAYADAIAALLANYLPLGGGTMAGDIDMDGHIIDGIPLPTTDNEAASKIYVDNAVGGAAGGVTGNLQWNNGGTFAGDPNFNTDGVGNVTIVGSLTGDNLRLDGNTLSSTDANGDINLTPNGTGQVKVPTPTAVNSAVTKAYADAIQAQLANYLLRSGGTMTGPINMGNSKITSLATPTVGTDAVTKDYVDATAAGKYFVAPVRASATANFSATYNNGVSGVGATLTATANGAAAFDGVTFALNDRVLFPFQSSSLQNGIYIVTNLGGPSAKAVYTRAADYDQPSEIDPGDSVGVTQGTLYSGAFFMQTATVTSIGTSPITFSLSVNPNVVTINTSQTVTGNKTFTGNINFQVSNVTYGAPGTDATAKSYRSTIFNYNNSDGIFAFIFAQTQAAANNAYIGGGIGVANAATNVYVYAAANTTTPTGSMIADFTVNGMRLGGANSRVTTILNENNMASNSATALATQASIKAYADSKGSVNSGIANQLAYYAANGSALSGLTPGTDVLAALQVAAINSGGAISLQTSGTWTPTFTFATPGDLSFSYTTRTGVWTRVGNIMVVSFVIAGTPTFTTSSGALNISGIPVAFSSSIYFSGVLSGAGVTYPSSRTTSIGLGGGTSINYSAYGSALSATTIQASAIATGVALLATGTIVYSV